jgi:hypothetical protein
MFVDYVDRIYPIELEIIKDITDTDRSDSYIDLHIQIDSNGQLKTTTVDIYKTSTISMWLHVIFTIPDISFVTTTFYVIHFYCYILVIFSAKVVVESIY